MSRRWTKKEDEILLDRYGKCSIKTLSKSLDRTPLAIKCRLSKIEGTHSIVVISGNMSTKDVSEIMGVHISTVRSFIKNKKLPYIKPNEYYFVPEDSFWKWLKLNIELVNFINIKDEIEQIVPDWFKNEIKTRKRNFKKDIVGKKVWWTRYEETLAWNLFLKGYSNKQIASELNRTEISVKSKLKYMTKKKIQKVGGF